MIRNEIDRYDYTSCPFNLTHRFSPEQYQYHIIRCKDRHFSRVAENMRPCPHNSLHIFTDPIAFNYHTPRCPDFPGRLKYTSAGFGSAPQEIKYETCPYNQLHGVMAGEVESFNKHLAECPNKVVKARSLEIPQPAIDMSLSGQLNYKHGLISSKDITIVPVDVPKAKVNLAVNVINLHFCGKIFTVFKEDRGNGVEERDIWVHHLTFANPREWGGLKMIEDSRAHGQYLVGLLYPDKSSPITEGHWTAFCKYLTCSSTNKNSIAVCFQSSSEKNRLILLVHRSEDTGFGRHITNNSEIGVFYLQHSLLYNSASLVTTLQSAIQSEKLEKTEIRASLISSEQQRDRAINDFNSLKLEHDLAVNRALEQKGINENMLSEYNKEISKYKTQALHQMELMRKDFQTEKNEDMLKLDKITSEKNTLQMNFYAEIQNMKKNDKSTQDKVLALMEELKSCQMKNRELNEQANVLRGRMAEGRKEFAGGNIEAIVDEAVCLEREKIHNMYMDKEVCSICTNEKKNVVFMPCGHFNYCSICIKAMGIEIGKQIPLNKQFSRCSVCQSVIEKVFKAYPF